jgi:hypothetical protein
MAAGLLPRIDRGLDPFPFALMTILALGASGALLTAMIRETRR